MILLPGYLKRFQKKAEEYLSLGLVKDVEFSRGTYQVLVVDPNTKSEEWAFIQLNAQGRLKDSFCTCEYNEEHQSCVHQAVAFLYIYGQYSQPLHKRFEKSLWNALFSLCAKEFGSQSAVIEVNDSTYICRNKLGKDLFHVVAKTPFAKARLEKIFFLREEQTEETSLKFSNLPDEELVLWHQGKPSSQLSYELSFWSDLAKWFMTLQEGKEKYEIQFTYGKNKLPNALLIEFKEVSAQWILTQQWLEAIIPALSTVESPLTIHNASKREIKAIKYDRKTKHFVIIPKSNDEVAQFYPKNSKGMDLKEWFYLPGDGFYSKKKPFKELSELWDDVESTLNDHASEIKDLMVDTPIHEAPATVSYQLHFDENWNLHVHCYLFTPGDLSSSKVQTFGMWVYLEEKGFYRLGKSHFDDVDLEIPEEAVADFVNQNRTWLNAQEGFRTFVNPLESTLAYTLRNDQFLIFSRRTVSDENESRDFGMWVYLPGQGFFSKVHLHTNLAVHSGTAIPPQQIHMFINENKQELELVPNFFSQKSPLASVGLDIHLVGDHINVIPHYELLDEYKNKSVYFFDEYSYVKDEGFCPFPIHLRLPERYHSAISIKQDKIEWFLLNELPNLVPFIHSIDDALKRPESCSLIAKDISQTDEIMADRRYSLQLVYETEFGTLSLESLWKAVHRNERFVFSDSGLIDLQDKQFGWLKLMKKKAVGNSKGRLDLSAIELLRLNAFTEITVAADTTSVQKRSLEVFNELIDFKHIEDPDITGLRSHLREYQMAGVQWLYFLYRHGLSGLLCDDMGLGKTHQAMALVMSVANYWRRKRDKTKRHFLIVCPTSVIYHWQEKLSAFLPDLKVWTFYGAKRSLDTFYADCDILLTSYGIWRNEAELLRSLTFEIAIFDELQIAKNQTSRIYNALLKVNAKMRLGMTGTPIENQLRELKALFDIILPSYMPPEKDYREFFIRPIEKEADAERRVLLSKLVRPFVLRRKKEDVLLDLPEKIEEIAHCDLLSDQHSLYVDVLKLSREKILQELRDEESPVPYIHIFALLSHLKQICNHPAAFLKKPQEYKRYQSGKWDLFVELLEEARESKQKIVVFSQYLAMLDIIENYLKEHHIGYATIRGATVNRGDQLRRFNDDPECEVFVGSLQAAGLGVDLTAGSVVIHYDRWWNAARENQATDRVHRIGQTRGVQVFKLLTKNTLEEYIDQLIARKGRLMEEVIAVDDHDVVKKFNREELIELFQTLPKGS